MKRILFVMLVMALLLTLSVTVCAETSDEVNPDPSESGTPAIEKGKNDYSEVAKQFIGYIQSGEAPQELIDSIIVMGEEMQEMKEQGYTLQERLLQLISPDHILTTVGAVFLVVAGVVLFWVRGRLKSNGLDIEDTLAEVQELKKKLESKEAEQEKTEAVRAADREQLSRIETMLGKVLASSQNAGRGSTAVAKMVKDVFLNSRTIDADGKALLTHNYLEATGELNGEDYEHQEKA